MPLVKYCDPKYYLYIRKEGEIPDVSQRTSQNNRVLPNKTFGIYMVICVLILQMIDFNFKSSICLLCVLQNKGFILCV